MPPEIATAPPLKRCSRLRSRLAFIALPRLSPLMVTLGGGGGKTGGDRHRANLLLRMAGNSDIGDLWPEPTDIFKAGKGRELVKQPRGVVPPGLHPSVTHFRAFGRGVK